MPVQNYTQNLINILDGWFQGKFKGDRKSLELLRVKFILRDDIFGSFFGYFLTILSLVYLIFFICMLIVFVKEKMLGIVQVILLTTTAINLLPLLTGTPFFFIFRFIADKEEPVPYPSCLLIVIFFDIFAKIFHAANLLLKILMGVNRLCSVCYPFKMRIWFSNFRCTIYVTCIISFTVTLGCILSFIDLPVVKTRYVGDVWGNGKKRAYDTCSLEKVSMGHTPNMTFPFLFSLIQLALSFGLIGSLIILNIIFVIKLGRLKSQSPSDPIGNQMNKRNNRKIYLFNKIAFWIMVTSIVTEIPHAILIGYTFMRILNLMSVGTEEFSYSQAMDFINVCAAAFFKLVIPLDLLIFVCLSKKVRVSIKKLLTCS